MKKFLIALSITLFAFGPIIANGSWVHNKGKGSVKVKIDKGLDKNWIELKAGAKRFFKTSSSDKIGIYWRYPDGDKIKIWECQTKKYKSPTDFILGLDIAIKTKKGLLRKKTHKENRNCDCFFPRTIKLPNYDKIYEKLKPLLENKNLKQTDEKRKAIVNLYNKSRRDKILYNKIAKAFKDEGSTIELMIRKYVFKMPIKFEK